MDKLRSASKRANWVRIFSRPFSQSEKTGRGTLVSRPAKPWRRITATAGSSGWPAVGGGGLGAGPLVRKEEGPPRPPGGGGGNRAPASPALRDVVRQYGTHVMD